MNSDSLSYIQVGIAALYVLMTELQLRSLREDKDWLHRQLLKALKPPDPTHKCWRCGAEGSAIYLCDEHEREITDA